MYVGELPLLKGSPDLPLIKGPLAAAEMDF